MSSEEWQRRKSVLIRSLFHDISIPSTVEEESTDSSQDYYVPPQEVFLSLPRPYSPLPPLIIERVPITNKHDEPEEYYIKLHKKMKRLYRKLFIENQDLSSIDYDLISANDSSVYDRSVNDSSVNDSSVNDISVNDNSVNHDNLTITSSDGSGSFENLDLRFLKSISPKNKSFKCSIEDRGARQSSGSTKSTGYGEVSDSENVDEDDLSIGAMDDWRSSEHKKSNTERIDNENLIKEQNSRHSTINDEEMTESEKSNETVGQSYEEEESNHETIDEHGINVTNLTEKSDRVLIDDPELSREDAHYSRNNDQEMDNSQDSTESENEHESENQTKTDSDSHDSEPKPNRSENASEGSKKAVVPNDEPMEADVETSASSEGAVYRQITTEALVHVDGSKNDRDRESRIYEDSLKSVILPTRFKRVASRNVDVDDRIKVLAVLEEKDDPKVAPIIDSDDDEITEDFEQIRTCQADTSDEHSKEMRISLLDDFDEEIGDWNIDEMKTLRQEAFEKNNKAMRTHQSDSFEKYLYDTAAYRPDATEKEIEEMRTPCLGTPQEEAEEMSTSTPKPTDEPIEEIRTVHPDATKAEERTHQTETYEEEDGEENDDEMDSPHPIEQMRTPRRDLSHGTIPTTHESTSESTNEHTVVLQEPTAMTSSSQDGEEQNIFGRQTSNDMNEMLTSIFNESRSKNEPPVSGRKRKLVDKSVQAVPTRRVTWDEMRANFFVGTPKIFRLCACTDHDCY